MSNESSHVYKFGVAMSCGGCSGAITRVLGKLEGIKSFDVSLENQLVTVETNGDTPSYDTVLKTIKKTGKKVLTGEADGNPQSIEIVE